jgi:hypothetical protein
MPYQNIDATISVADLQAVKDSFDAVLSKLPFLVTLTPNERISITKTGPDSVSFVENALVTAQGNEKAVPESFDIAAFERDVKLFAALNELQMRAESVTSQLDDTRLAVGGEAMQSAMQVYQYLKTASKNTPGLKPAVDQLSERFAKASRGKTGDGSPGTPKTP